MLFPFHSTCYAIANIPRIGITRLLELKALSIMSCCLTYGAINSFSWLVLTYAVSRRSVEACKLLARSSSRCVCCILLPALYEFTKHWQTTRYQLAFRLGCFRCNNFLSKEMTRWVKLVFRHVIGIACTRN